MNPLEEWLGSRRPDPPAELDLRPWLAGVGSESGRSALRALHDQLARAGLAALDRAAARPGRVRESAFHLLVADALLTYACEAALESTDPESALLRTLEAGFGR